MIIILLMITPLRSVMAEQNSHCNMDEMPAEMTTMSHSAATHSMHHAHFAMDKSENQQATHNCCCCDGDSCGNNCEMSVTASILMRISNYAPVFVSSAETPYFSSNILVRALAPPTRPPLKLS